MPRSAQISWGGVFAAFFLVLAIFGARGMLAARATNSRSDEILRFSAEYGVLILVLGTVSYRLIRGDRAGRGSLLPIPVFWLVSLTFVIVAIAVHRTSAPDSIQPERSGVALRLEFVCLALSGLAAASAIAAHRRRRAPGLPPVIRKDE
jgi:hypothetical protein